MMVVRCVRVEHGTLARAADVYALPIRRLRLLGLSSCYQLQVGQNQRIGQGLEVVFFGQPRREVLGFVLTGFAQGAAVESAERFFHVCSLCNNLSADWGFSVGIGLRRLSGAFVFVLKERP